MLALVLSGQREAAVAQYLGFCRVLAEEFGLELLKLLRAAPPGLGGRIGVHTGVVVIASGEAGALEVAGLPAVAAQRMQGVAGADELLISGVGERLVRGFFALEPLGRRALEGLAAPLELYRVLSETTARSRLEARPPRTALLGRERELSALLRRWERARSGRGHSVLVTGEAGIGKSRLVYALKETLEREPHRWLEAYGSAYYASSPFHPVTDLIMRELGFAAHDAPEAKLAKLEAALVLERLMALSSEQAFSSWLGYARVWQGLFWAEAGQSEGLALARQGLDLFDALGTVTHRPLLLGIYASAPARR